ncbi:MAG TPA: DUF5685 family protein [Bryobacteraceae bacterium]|jgi:hypothetical protein|nr:DUF5685 family protein [Bryobacteraceae bacterium]
MFGLMKRAGRMAYCGSCKTMGALYGHRARLVLNHDTVFLAELLMEISGEPEWSAAHRSFNCMSMPREHPFALEYAATAAVVLAHFQIEDQILDGRGWLWGSVRHFFSPAYRRAARRMRDWGFPLSEMKELLASQGDREARRVSLADVAEPTARAAEMVFSYGEKLTLTCAPLSLGWIGRRFGYLVYVLDAWEDRERDRKSGDFNALIAFPEVDGRAEILAAVASLEKDLSPDLAARLRTNVEERLGMRMRVLHGVCRKSAGERWRSAVEFARSMRERERAGFLKGAAVLGTVSVLAFLVPHQIRGAESWRHCFGLVMNLMAVGAIFATVPVPEMPESPGKKSAKFSGCCDCDSCGDCCDSCDCGDCGSCCDCG